MRSVPPRGSEWVYWIADCQLRIFDWRLAIRAIANRKSGPLLLRGGTDLTT